MSNSINNINIYITNIASRPDRKTRMNIVFKDIPFQYNELSVDKKDLKGEDLSEICNNSKMTYGEIACAISHFNMWSKKGIKVIHEDDINIHPHYKEKLYEYINILLQNNTWDIVLIGRNCFGDDFMDCFIEEPDLINNAEFKKLFYKPKKLGYGMHGYIISDRILSKLQSVYPLTDPIDVLLNKWTDKLNIYVARELLCEPVDFKDSDTSN